MTSPDRSRRAIGSARSSSSGGSGRRTGGDERGSGTVLILAVTVVLVAVTGGLVVIAGYVAAAHAARGAADLVALSGAAAHARGQSACLSARRIGAENGVHLVACTVKGDSWDFVVTVTVEQPVAFSVPSLPRSVPATAHAGRLGLAG